MKTVWKSIVCGTVGGIAGAWAMYRFRVAWERREGFTEKQGIFGFDAEADIQSVDELWNALALPALSEQEALKTALVLHFGFGAVSGGVYGWACERFPSVRKGLGLLFGTCLWILADEVAMTATGLSDPFAKEPAGHLSALLAHQLFGGVTELVRRGLTRAL